MNVLKILQGLFLVALTLALSVTGLLTASAFKWANDIQTDPALDLAQLDTDTSSFAATSQVFDRNNSRIGEILPYSETLETTNRIPVTLEQVSPAALQAIMGYEDSDFFAHYGFDLPGIAKAFYEQFFGSQGRGGSTITTQVIKNELLSEQATDRSLERKVKEVMLAVELESRLTKPEILQRYINVVYWGGNVRGIHAAAQAYFNKNPIDLTLAEGLYLARLIPSPGNFHDDFATSRKTMRTILDRMVRNGTISKDMANRAWKEKLQPKGWKVDYDNEGNVLSAEPTGEDIIAKTTISTSDPMYGQVNIAVRNWIRDKYGLSLLQKGGLKIYTTIDPQAQRAAEEASLNAEVPPGAQLAFVGIDPATGEVLAMMGEKRVAGETPKELNRALQSARQPGSSFKPIAFATAMEVAGFTQATVMVDQPTAFKVTGQDDYKPGNHDKKFMGAMTVRQALNKSRNIPAIKALEAATADAVVARAKELGYENVLPVWSLALGSIEATPLQHAGAYSAFANGGIKMEEHYIKRIEDANGRVIYEAKPRSRKVWSPQTAYIMLDTLHGNVVDASAFSLRAAIEGRWVAGKTGTTNEERDIWFVGMTPGMVSAVWIGFDNNDPIPKEIDPALTRAGDGDVGSSRQPVYIWKEFVEAALRGKPAGEFPVPEGITFRNMDLTTGGSGGTRAAFDVNTQLNSSGLQSQMTIEVPFDKCANKRAVSTTTRDCLEIRPIRASEIGSHINQ
ncbi:MAG: transglycosylase domain-containing protein [Trueperaceae bacterium]